MGKRRATAHGSLDGTKLRPYFEPWARQSELADRAGVSRPYVNRVINGESPLTPRLLAAARELGLPVDRLYGLETEKQNGGPEAAARKALRQKGLTDGKHRRAGR